MGNIGPLELGIVLLIVLVIFGPKRLPGLGRQLGSGMREFKDSISGKNVGDDDDDDDTQAALGRPELSAATTTDEPAQPAARPDDAPVTGA